MTFAELIAAAEKGAASVYHAVLATGAEIVSWETNPLIAPLVSAGVSAANDMLTRAGVDAGVVASDVTTSLKAIAAADPTVPSIGGLTNLAGTIVSTILPGAAGAVAVAEGVIGTVEGLAGAGSDAAS
jgi:hypothetical protein